jgi:hypothetical protein
LRAGILNGLAIIAKIGYGHLWLRGVNFTFINKRAVRIKLDIYVLIIDIECVGQTETNICEITFLANEPAIRLETRASRNTKWSSDNSQNRLWSLMAKGGELYIYQ